MNSRLLNIPAILVAVLTVSIGAYIYNSSQSTITDAMDSLSTQETNTFNSLFVMYEGEQTGSNVKALIGKLISNANTNVDDSSKVPYVYIDQLNETSLGQTEVVFRERDEGDATEYIDELNNIRTQINTKHEYYVEMSYQNNGLIDYINISFDPLNTISDLKHRNQKNNLFESNIDNNIDKIN